MSVKLEKIPLVPWSSRTSKSLVVLPNEEVLALRAELGDLDVAGLVPPYAPGEWSFNATTAVMARGAFMHHTVLAPIPAANTKEAREYLEIFTGAGFKGFIMPEAPQGVPIQHRAGRWNQAGLLHDNYWYHLAGGRGVDIPSDVPGRWTWSEEEM